jgi:DnaD/phage-associated family protein
VPDQGKEETALSQSSIGSGELWFLQALLKSGFVQLPRMLFEYSADMALDYDTIGKLSVLLSIVGPSASSPYEQFVISRTNLPQDFEQMRRLVAELEQKDLVESTAIADGEAFEFSLTPLYARLRAHWEHYREQHEAERSGPHPAVAVAEQLFGRPLSPNEMEEILNWAEEYGFDPEMVAAVIQEGKRQNIWHLGYLRSIARRWHEQGIRTLEQVEAESGNYQRGIARFRPILQYLGLKRQLTKPEQELLEKWTTEWGFSNEVILRAADEASGSKNPIHYMNRVLENWRAKNVKTVSDVETLQEEYKRNVPKKDEGARRAAATRKPTSRSNVLWSSGEKKDKEYYAHIYKKFES